MACIKRRLTYVVSIAAVSLFFLFSPAKGYAMQPPPPPLNMAHLKTLVVQADLIIVGRITAVEDAEGIVEATVRVEKLLKGKPAGKTIEIKETYKPAALRTPAPEAKNEGEPPKMIVRTTAGPGAYHGKYQEGSRIVVLLAKIEGCASYKPLGSGTYNKYLGEFLIEDGGIKSIETDYFRFAQDVEKYTATENKFINLIKKLIKSNSNKGDRDG